MEGRRLIPAGGMEGPSLRWAGPVDGNRQGSELASGSVPIDRSELVSGAVMHRAATAAERRAWML